MNERPARAKVVAMTSALLTPLDEAAGSLAGDILDCEVRDFMTPGCLSISDDASVARAAASMALHRVHAILVVGAVNGTPLGWVTARGLLGWLGRDRSLASARDAITEQVTAIHPDEPVRVALYALSTAGTTRLLVRRRPHQLPEGVLTDFDLAVAAGR
jgi:CBS domain-containing protein